MFDRTHFAFRSNSLAACVDYTLATDAVLIHTHVMRDIFAADGLVEIIQRQDPRPAIAGLYVLKDRRGEDRIEDLIDRISHAARATLPPLQ